MTCAGATDAGGCTSQCAQDADTEGAFCTTPRFACFTNSDCPQFHTCCYGSLLSNETYCDYGCFMSVDVCASNSDCDGLSCKPVFLDGAWMPFGICH
jgi:hypothetical protein